MKNTNHPFRRKPLQNTFPTSFSINNLHEWNSTQIYKKRYNRRHQEPLFSQRSICKSQIKHRINITTSNTLDSTAKSTLAHLEIAQQLKLNKFCISMEAKEKVTTVGRLKKGNPPRKHQAHLKKLKLTFESPHFRQDGRASPWQTKASITYTITRRRTISATLWHASIMSKTLQKANLLIS